ncbi:hypothetical protein KO02_09005 [Sphingobacterium sp. ML3W]|uniref:hypothetical protein n=1 Tax=Sphingobacterium sp. ML3W TaxID=1538644 RepID=UPI0004F9249B|nr:hypothetical protein [Sphingobacterium sp. ML3W]AIM36824.1 hypothetical protein KO02_09005 [Sphingobacterium sp. ML3W]
MATQWYSFTGGNPADSNNYTAVGGTAPTCSSPTQQLCAIFTDNDVNGDADLNLIALEMVQALQSQANTTNVILKRR